MIRGRTFASVPTEVPKRKNGISHEVIFVVGVGEMKPCSPCMEYKPLEDFHLDGTAKSGRTTQCKDCANKNARRSHDKRMENPEWVAQRREICNALIRANKSKAVDYKGGKCEDCGNIYPDYVYDFHHLSGDTKTDNPSAILRRSWDKAKEELDLCILVCANCHRERHFGKAGEDQ